MLCVFYNVVAYFCICLFFIIFIFLFTAVGNSQRFTLGGALRVSHRIKIILIYCFGLRTRRQFKSFLQKSIGDPEGRENHFLFVFLMFFNQLECEGRCFRHALRFGFLIGRYHRRHAKMHADFGFNI